ncbi:PREDICTED: uncharacterized protein LOC106329500 isoform X1 [Brassica oleracea var. oleracea]|uniref:uncharacterized protein LOC106329500 isoform X1 n=1 Tax=Brassica oleracea var. oleracea TaxID=109376 RepID=UPI0006A6D8D4|nr:PREDICTED: uncharacterized protein LOC106329500 isoform X1 [Brassica oleracea var. oleracea]
MTISKVSGVISTLVKGQSLIDCSVLDEVELATCVVFLVHLQLKERPVKKIYFWDHAAKDFYKKFTSSEHNPTVLLVTPVNTKRLVVLHLAEIKAPSHLLTRNRSFGVSVTFVG